MIRAIFLDRDGTINVERRDYVRATRELVLLPGALAALVRLATLDVPIFVITNQSCVGRGLLSEAQLEAINCELATTVRNAGGRIDGFYVCTHSPDEGCNCRKPRPGLLLQAMADHKLRADECIMVGDSLSDCSAADAAGCRCILVCTGLQGEMLATKMPAAPDFVENGNGLAYHTRSLAEPQIAQSLWHASRLILEQAYRTERNQHVA